MRFEEYKGLVHSADAGELKDLGEWMKAVVPEVQ